jgi:hypothetical protein
MLFIGIKSVALGNLVSFLCGCVYHHVPITDSGYRGQMDNRQAWFWMQHHDGALTHSAKNFLDTGKFLLN